MGYSIGGFSRATGLSTDTLRYYEKENIILPGRDASGRRVYTEQDARWIFFVSRLKETGMPLRDIKIYAQLWYMGEGTTQDRLNILKNHRCLVLSEKEKWESNLKHLDDKIRMYEDRLRGR